jgi:hypothetical protein
MSSACAQTANETITWINANLSPNEQGVTFSFTPDRATSTYRWDRSYNRIVTVIFANLKQVRVSCYSDDAECFVIFTGGVSDCVVDEDGNAIEHGCLAVSTVKFHCNRLNDSLNAQRVVNAFTKLAQLGGAHLVNDDLF